MNEDIWAEIDAVYLFPERKSGDINSTQMSKRYGVGLSAAQRKMHKMADTGEYELITVRDPTSAKGTRNVLRKV